MQHDVRGRPTTHDLVRAYKARFGDQPVPESEDDLREALGWDEILDRLNRDEPLASVPDDFDVYEAEDVRVERIRRMRAGLASLLRGDPEEHRESWDILRAAIEDASVPEGSTSTA